eukprot:CAMPEP_0183351236 /NCGR_PEP_ID=MMETSP0164_2-20130417/23440_1 /TAXON_ID=221442 /ORGANISM="Coccolithus pelagicus ssp braarudi, Strain PLY182g" /LENGTH=124 /DNA_ID=CAMNT_0025523355 /DNA_START=35 /DNA_END=409 /DNA_ORIENTATION=-
MAPKGSKSKGKARKQMKFVVKCGAPVDDEIFDIASFEKFLHDRIKVNGKAGQLGESVSIERDTSNVTVTVKGIQFSKRYIKYLTKKFLKKQQLRDYIRVISDSKNAYDLRYFNINNEEAEEEAE